MTQEARPTYVGLRRSSDAEIAAMLDARRYKLSEAEMISGLLNELDRRRDERHLQTMRLAALVSAASAATGAAFVVLQITGLIS